MDNSKVDVLNDDFDGMKVSTVELEVYGSVLLANLANYPLVGGGDITNDYCGNFSSFYTCDRVDLHKLIGLKLGKDYANKVFVRKVHFNCGNLSCPVCYRYSWVIREARKALARLEATSKLLKEISSESGAIEHIVISVPPKLYGITDEKVLRVMCKKALEALGVFDYCMIFHGSRHRRYEQIKGRIFR